MPRQVKKDLFSPTVEPKASLLPPAAASLTVSHDVEKVMVMLSPRQVTALDRVCLEIRQTTGMKFKRSMLIRALIDGFLMAPLSFKEARSYDDIARKVLESFHTVSRAT